MTKTSDVLFRYLPIRISQAVHSLPTEIFEGMNEIRIRKNAPLSVTVGARNIFLDESGKICHISRAIKTDDREMREIISRLTNGSLYTYGEYIKNGFIPLPEGGRAGVCGKAVVSDGRITYFSEITSIDLRLHRFIPDFAAPLIDEYRKNGTRGTIICSPPALGKTTFLRSTAYLLSTGSGIKPKRVAVADERCEISVGIERFGTLDILSGAPKAEAISILTRSMAPEIIICDEISGSETDAVIEAQNTGVSLIASAHCHTPKELYKRGRLKALIDSGIFPLAVILEYDGGYNCHIGKTEDFL